MKTPLGDEIDRLQEEVTRLRSELTWFQEQFGTREDIILSDQEDDEDWERIQALPKDQIDAELRKAGIDPVEVTRRGMHVIDLCTERNRLQEIVGDMTPRGLHRGTLFRLAAALERDSGSLLRGKEAKNAKLAGKDPKHILGYVDALIVLEKVLSDDDLVDEMVGEKT